MDNRNRGRHVANYNLFEKSYLKKSKKVLSKVEESRSKSNSRPITRNVSPIIEPKYSNYPGNLVDTKKYLDLKKESGGILYKKTSNDRSYLAASHTSKSPVTYHNNNYVANSNNTNNTNNTNNFNKQKNQFSQSQLEKSYTKSSHNNSQSNSNINAATHQVSKTNKDKNYNQNYYSENVKDAKNKSRDFSGNRSTTGLNPSYTTSKKSSAVKNVSNYVSHNYEKENNPRDKMMVNSSYMRTSHLSNTPSNQNIPNPINAINPINKNSKTNNYIAYNSHTGNNNNFPEEYNEPESYLKYSQTSKKSKVPSVKVSNDKERRPKSNLGNSHYAQTNTQTNSYTNCYTNGNHADFNDTGSVYTNYKKMKKNTEGVSSQANESSHFTFDKTFGKFSEVSNNLKRMNLKSPYQYQSALTDCSLYNSEKNAIINTNESRYNTDTTKSRFQDLQNTSQIYLEKKDSFSLLKISQLASDSLNKETSDSNKFKMTNTHSTGYHSALHSLEEVKALFNKLDPEEYHLVSINLIQGAKRVVRVHEHTPDKDNLFSTVTNCEEKDL